MLTKGSSFQQATEMARCRPQCHSFPNGTSTSVKMRQLSQRACFKIDTSYPYDIIKAL